MPKTKHLSLYVPNENFRPYSLNVFDKLVNSDCYPTALTLVDYIGKTIAT